MGLFKIHFPSGWGNKLKLVYLDDLPMSTSISHPAASPIMPVCLPQFGVLNPSNRLSIFRKDYQVLCRAPEILKKFKC
jgi:hypothetical protein